MPWMTPAVRLVLMGALLGSAVPWTQGHAQDCTPPHRIQILDLDMVPDPIERGKTVEAWRVTLQSDRNGECSTALEIRDADQIAGRSAKHLIRPGKGAYTVQAAPGYQFRGRDHCFQVQANVGGTFTPLEAQRTFCARDKSGHRWSLKER